MTPKHIRIGIGVLIGIVAIIVYFTGVKVVASYGAPNGNAGYDTNTPGSTNGTVSGTTRPPPQPLQQAVDPRQAQPMLAPPAQPTSPQNTPPAYSDGTY